MKALLDSLLFPETITVYEVLTDHATEDGQEWLRVYIDYSAETIGGGRSRSIQKYAIDLATEEVFDHNQLYSALIRATGSTESADDLIRMDYEDSKKSSGARKFNADKILKLVVETLK